MRQRSAAVLAMMVAAALAGCGHVRRQGGAAGGQPQGTAPLASLPAADASSPPTPAPEAAPVSAGPPDTTCADPAADRAAASGAGIGAGVVLKTWITLCLAGGPLTLAVCVIGFPEYWPYLAGGVVVAGGFGALVGGASAGRVPCPAPPDAAPDGRTPAAAWKAPPASARHPAPRRSPR